MTVLPLILFLIHFFQHNPFQARYVREHHFLSPGMELTELLHVFTDSLVDGMLHRDWIVIPGMYVVQIILRDREHLDMVYISLLIDHIPHL